MLPPRYFLQILACLVSCDSAFGTFFAAAPNEFRPGWPLAIAVTAHQSNEDRIFIDAVLTPANDKVDVYNVVSDFVSPGETKILKLQVPELVLAPGSRAFLKVSSFGKVKHSSEKQLKYNANSSLVFVQTDKAIYKPGQKVRLRVVHADKNLQPIIKPLTIVIVNPKDSKLEEFKDIASRTGVVDLHYDLLESASLGTWNIQVKDGNNLLYRKEFQVEEYVLPKFSVEVKADPGYIITGSQSSSVITVQAKYTHGKGVQGECSLTLSHSGTNSLATVTKKLSETGIAEFSDINWKPFHMIHSDPKPNLVITASVTDETGRTEVGQTSVTFYLIDAKVEILPKSTTVFRIGLPADIFIRVTDQGGNPINKQEVEFEINLVGMQNVKTNLTVPNGQVDLHYNFTPVAEPNDSDKRLWRPRDTMKARLVSDSRAESTEHVFLYKSEYDNAITAVPVSDQVPKVGEKVDYKILKSSQSSQFTAGYMVISQGSIIDAGSPQEDIISIVPTLEMCPMAKLFVYMIVGEENLEVVADSLDISPTHCFAKEVDVSFDAAEVRSGVNATLKVHVNRLDGSNELPGAHNVYYLGVDKSLVLLQGRTDLSTDQVLSGLSGLNLRSHSRVNSQYSPRSAGKVITGLGLVTFTSVNMTRTEPTRFNEDFEIEADMIPRVAFDNGSVRSGKAGVKVAFNKNVQPVEAKKVPAEVKVRKNFPETWLWGHAMTDTRGHLNHAVTLPDTITTWLVSAFAISDEGLVAARGPFELTAFQIFFLTMNLPYSIKRGEIFTLRITVFNYRTKTVEGVVKLASSAQFSALNADEKDGWYYKVVEIPANRAASVEYKINASMIGLMELHAIAEDVADDIRDEVQQKLLVKPEGEMRSKAITKVLFLKSHSSIDETFVINWPQDKIVPDSRTVEVKVTGVPLGQSLSNLQRLVSVPYGCGEQNMITTVPNIYGLTYIQATDPSGTSELKNSMVINMKSGYQRQIDMYRHADGSYSAWGPKTSYHAEAAGTSGSVWLTAFVVKSFSRAAEFITVDPAVLSSGAKFLAGRQSKSGAFVESGQVFHAEMQAGTGKGTPLTVYVLISLLETNNAVGGDGVDIQQQIDRAVGYLMETIDPAELRRNDNRFLAAMAAYALSLTPDRTSVNLLLSQLLSVVADGGAPWESQSEQPKMPATDYYMTVSPSYKVEIAAYYLLTLVRLGRLGDGLDVMKWLQSQQNSLGGYYSTQDTVMALQALSEFGVAFRSSPFATAVHVREPQSGQSFNVSMEGSRAFLLHTVQLPPETTTVHITATGPANSSCVVKVVYNYYTLAGDGNSTSTEPQLSVYTKTSVVSKNVQKVQACIQSSRSLKYQGMFVTTLALPSGEQALDDPSIILENNPKASRVEVNEGLIHFYMDKAPSEGYCLYAQVERQMEFEVQKPGSAKFYAYYEPDTVQEVALVMGGAVCSQDNCDTDSAIVLNLASVLLTISICLLVTLLLCV